MTNLITKIAKNLADLVMKSVDTVLDHALYEAEAPEDRFVRDSEHECPLCRGSGHKGDIKPELLVKPLVWESSAPMTDHRELVERLKAWGEYFMDLGPLHMFPADDIILAADALLSLQWKPIEDAPKDGTVIDVLLRGTARIPDVQWGMTDGLAEDIETWIDAYSSMPVWGPHEGPTVITHFRHINLPSPPEENG